MHGAADRDDELIGDHILRGERILRICSESVLGPDLADIDGGEFAADAGIAHVPAELVTRDIDHQGVLRGGTVDVLPDAVAVNREGQKNEGRGRGPDHLERVVPMAVVGGDAGTATVLDEVVDVGDLRDDEDCGAEPEDSPDKAIDLLADRGDAGRKEVDIAGALLGHRGGGKHDLREQDCSGKQAAGDAAEGKISHRKRSVIWSARFLRRGGRVASPSAAPRSRARPVLCVRCGCRPRRRVRSVPRCCPTRSGCR